MLEFFQLVGMGVCGVFACFLAAAAVWVSFSYGYPFCAGFLNHLSGRDWREIRRMTFSQKRCRVAAVRNWSDRRPFRLQPCRIGVGRRVRFYWAIRAGLETMIWGY